MTSSWFFLSTLSYDARSTTHQIFSSCIEEYAQVAHVMNMYKLLFKRLNSLNSFYHKSSLSPSSLGNSLLSFQTMMLSENAGRSRVLSDFCSEAVRLYYPTANRLPVLRLSILRLSILRLLVLRLFILKLPILMLSILMLSILRLLVLRFFIKKLPILRLYMLQLSILRLFVLMFLIQKLAIVRLAY